MTAHLLKRSMMHTQNYSTVMPLYGSLQTLDPNSQAEKQLLGEKSWSRRTAKGVRDWFGACWGGVSNYRGFQLSDTEVTPLIDTVEGDEKEIIIQQTTMIPGREEEEEEEETGEYVKGGKKGKCWMPKCMKTGFWRSKGSGKTDRWHYEIEN